MTNPTSRLNAALEGRYRIERALGVGGMADSGQAYAGRALTGRSLHIAHCRDA